jgi:phospholipase C
MAALVVLLGGAFNVGAGASQRPILNAPIKHVVEIMLENHTFDNLFGQFPGADGIPAGTTLPNPGAYFTSEPDVAPVYATSNEGDVQGNIDNSRPGEQMAMDYQPGAGYQMDNYTRYPFDGMSSITEFPAAMDPNLQYLAQHFTLADENFQPAIAPSNPNIHYALTGSANGWMYNNLQPGTSNATWYSIFDQLDASGMTSKIYYGFPTASQYWYQMIPTDRTQDVAPLAQLGSDLASGNLPNFSLVRADFAHYDQEPPEDITQGDAWLGQMVQQIVDSSEWSSTAIFVTYDEGGGFWDHVAPPVRTPYGYGTRTPTVVVSPFTPLGIDSQQTTNTSILRFMEDLWGLKPLNTFTAQQNDFMSAFKFGQSPAAAPVLPVVPTDTINFNDSKVAPAPGSTFTVDLQATNVDIMLDPSVSGTVSLTVIPPSGVSVPSGFPSSVTMTGGNVSFPASFSTAGYYRIEATGPDGSQGWTTVDVGVNPNTLP